MTTLADVTFEPGTPSPATRPAAFWGMWVLIATEGTAFLALLSAYFFVRANTTGWPEGGIAPPELLRISIFTAVLLGSSIPVVLAERAIRRGSVRGLRVGLAIAWLMGAAFTANQVIEMARLPFSAGDNAYASLFVVITGLHGLHLLVGLAMGVVVQSKAALGWFDERRHQTVTVFAMYWHFVDVVWVAVFASLYLSAHIR